MKKELVKVGMKVRINEQLYSKVSKEKYPENKFYVLSLVENTDYTYYVSDTEGFYDYKTFSIDCADFEPYEEPKEETTTYQVKDLEGNVIEEKVVEDKPEGYKIGSHRFNGSDECGYSYTLTFNKSMECITKHKGIEMGMDAFDRGDHLPITQEFIESFGFKRTEDSVIVKYFTKELYIEGERYIVNLCGGDSLKVYDLLISNLDGDKNFLFDSFKCTTQSELRFLLTKGRIDCSK